MGVFHPEIETEHFYQGFFRCKDGILDDLYFLFWGKKGEKLLVCVLPTLPSVATSDISLLLNLAANTRATSRSFLPHSSVFVARNIQAAAISCKNRYVGMQTRT